MKNLKYSIIALAVLLAVSLVVCGGLSIPAQAATSYYVDCSAGSNGDGSSGSPWNTLDSVNATTFAAGDAILFKRGATCTGQLYPKGSGASGNPITIGAYGSGARPIIDGNNAVDPAVRLFDQSYWEIADLEVKNSTGRGVYIDGSAGADLTYFRLTNIHSHHHGLHDGHDAILPGLYQNHSVHDVIIDNALTHNAFRGIETGGKCCNVPLERSTDVIIRNSVAFDTENDGMLMASVTGGVIENSVAYNTGLQPSQENHTPNGLWTWDCDDCTVQFCESYTAHSPEWDGGGFDIDYYSHNSLYQYNYGHDNDAYCIAVFGGDRKDTTTNSVVRYNICSNNAQDSSYEEKRQGSIYITHWSGGNIADTYVYNNTVYWNPAGDYYAIKLWNLWHGGDIINSNIYNNIIYAAGPKLVYVKNFCDETTMDYNLYWYTGAGDPEFLWDGTTYTSFSAFQSASGQEAHGLYADPKLNDPTYHGVGMPTTSFTLQSSSPAINAGADLVTLGLQSSMGTRDFFGNGIPNGAYDIGAHEYGGTPPEPTDTPIPPPTNTPGGPTETPIPPTDTPEPTETPAPTSTPGGSSNLALNKPVEVSSQNDSYPGTNAVDGSLETYWRTLKLRNNQLPRPPAWIYVNLQSTYSVSQVVLEWDEIGRYATIYSIQVSANATDWTTVYSESSGDGGTDVCSFGATNADYVRLWTTAWTNEAEGNWLDEIEVYE